MENDSHIVPSRRSYLKGIGAGAAGISALAGCTGQQDGGSGGDGGDGDGGGGDGSDGGSTGDGSSGSQPVDVTVTYPPTGWWATIGDIVADEGLIDKYLAEHGVEANFEIQRTWDGGPIFVSGQSDIAQFGTFEASLMGPEEDIDITTFGKVVPQFVEMLVKSGGDYDPENTGSVQASIDRLKETGDNVGIGAWSSGSVPGSRIVMEQQYDTAFSEEKADVNIVTAGFFAIAELITKDQLAAGHASPMLGGARFYLNDELTRLYHVGDGIANLGFGWAPLENQVCRTSFFEENPDVCKVYHDAKNEAMQILHEDPVGVITQSDKYIENLGVQNEEEAKFTVEYNINLNNPYTDLEPPEHPAVYSEYALTDEWIENDKQFLDRVAEIGMTDPNWADYVSYEKL